MGSIILWSTHCPRCKVLELKLKQKNIEFIENANIEEMTTKGFKEVPKLEVNGVVMDFKEAVEWIKEQ